MIYLVWRIVKGVTDLTGRSVHLQDVESKRRVGVGLY